MCAKVRVVAHLRALFYSVFTSVAGSLPKPH